MPAYYNEIEPAAAHVLEALIKDKVIADGVVDRRSIADVAPEDLADFTQCHFFAGGGLWSVAARLAGWPDDRELWTGSCPCQPFSVAGKGAGTDDPRHLWPHFHRLIRARRPSVVVGEQVSSKAGYDWFDGIRSDLESEDYASRAVDIPACAVDAPHIRQRLYWCAVEHASRKRRREGQPEHEIWSGRSTVAGSSRGDMADADGAEPKCRQFGFQPADRGYQRDAAEQERASFWHDADDARREGRAILPQRADERSAWSDSVEWRRGVDGKARRVKSGIRLLVARFSDCMDFVRDIEQQAWEWDVSYGENNRDAGETLRVLREAIHAQARRQEQPTGVRFQLHETQVLLDFLLCCEATCGGTIEPSMVAASCSDARQRIVRSLRTYAEFGCSPCRWEPDEQFAKQSSDALLALSLLLARLASTYRERTFDAYAASNRINLLRIGGNAIVAPLAAAVLEALMETL